MEMKTENTYDVLEQQTSSGFFFFNNQLSERSLYNFRQATTALFLRKIKRTFYKNEIYPMLQSCYSGNSEYSRKMTCLRIYVAHNIDRSEETLSGKKRLDYSFNSSYCIPLICKRTHCILSLRK